MTNIVLYMIVTLIYILPTTSYGLGNNSFDIPVFSPNGNVRYFNDKTTGGKRVEYFIKDINQEGNVISFYEQELEKYGFGRKPAEGVPLDKWIRFNSETQEYEKVDSPPMQYISSWKDVTQVFRADLILEYQVNNPVLLVTCSITPFFSEKNVEDFFMKLSESGDFVSFQNLMNKYQLPSGETDVEKALSENPDSELLKEFFSISGRGKYLKGN